MTVWRPRPAIRLLVIGLAVQEGRLLAAEVTDDAGRLKGVRPLGGEVEFGETREAALHREFREELDCAIEIDGPWVAIENLYVHEGAPGHEMVFAAPIRILDRDFAVDAPVVIEDGGAPVTVRWFALDRLKRGEVPLFPTGLLDQLGL